MIGTRYRLIDRISYNSRCILSVLARCPKSVLLRLSGTLKRVQACSCRADVLPNFRVAEG